MDEFPMLDIYNKCLDKQVNEYSQHYVLQERLHLSGHCSCESYMAKGLCHNIFFPVFAFIYISEKCKSRNWNFSGIKSHVTDTEGTLYWSSCICAWVLLYNLAVGLTGLWLYLKYCTWVKIRKINEMLKEMK